MCDGSNKAGHAKSLDTPHVRNITHFLVVQPSKKEVEFAESGIEGPAHRFYLSWTPTMRTWRYGRAAL